MGMVEGVRTVQGPQPLCLQPAPATMRYGAATSPHCCFIRHLAAIAVISGALRTVPLNRPLTTLRTHTGTAHVPRSSSSS